MMTLSLDPQLVAQARTHIFRERWNDEEEGEQGIGQAIGEAIGSEGPDGEEGALGQGWDDVEYEGQGEVVSTL